MHWALMKVVALLLLRPVGLRVCFVTPFTLKILLMTLFFHYCSLAKWSIKNRIIWANAWRTCECVMCALNSSIVVLETVMSLNIPSSFDVNWQPHSTCQSRKNIKIMSDHQPTREPVDQSTRWDAPVNQHWQQSRVPSAWRSCFSRCHPKRSYLAVVA